MSEQAFAPALKRLVAVYIGEAQRAINDACREEAAALKLPEGTTFDPMRGVWILPEQPNEPAAATS
jgi:hypothetical protein